MRLIHDKSKCFGCKACVSACKDVNNLPPGVLLMDIVEQESKAEGITITFSQKVCLQCNNPVCISACPKGAIVRDENGIVHILPEQCVGCGNCKRACINHAIHQKGSIMVKCELCKNNGNEVPACVQACPMNCIEVSC